MNYPPRLLSEDAAATYCGVSRETLRRKCPIKPVPHPFGARTLYDRAQLDKWVDSLSGVGAQDNAPKPSDAF